MSDKKKQVEKMSYSTSLRNPRIVRAPRDSGGKDRHSKVCTLRGLRDRRIRLSVPTAVQLYDLQDRLGLPQPSKVVDWLLEAARDDVDRLPPLPAIPGLSQPRHERPPEAAMLGGLQNFFPAGGGGCITLPYDGSNSGSNNNDSNNNNNYNNNYYFGDSASLSLAGYGGFPALAPVPGPGSHHQLYLCQPTNANLPASIFPPFGSYEAGSAENDESRQINFLQN